MWPVQKPSKDCFCWWEEEEQFCLLPLPFQLKGILSSFSSTFHLTSASQQRAKGIKPRSMTYKSIQYCGDKIVSNSFYFIHCLVSLVQFFWCSQDGAFRIDTYNLKKQFPLWLPWHVAFENTAIDSWALVSLQLLVSHWLHTHSQANSYLVSYSFLLTNIHSHPHKQNALLLLAPWQPILSPQTVGSEAYHFLYTGFVLFKQKTGFSWDKIVLIHMSGIITAKTFCAKCKQVSFILFTIPCLYRKIFTTEKIPTSNTARR